MQGTVSGAGTLSFWAKVSGETKRGRLYDYLDVTVDGVSVFASADADWTNLVVEVSGSGEHTIRWTYTKDASNAVGDDCAWLDEVTWVPAPTGAFVDVSGMGTVSPTTGGYLVSANAGVTLTAADIKVYSTVDGATVETTKGYKVVVGDGGNTATVTLLSPYEVVRANSDDSLWTDDGDGNITLNVEIVPGLYYAAASAASIDALRCPGSSSPATSNTILKVAKPNSDSQGFFKVWVSDSAIAPDGN